MDYSPPGSFDHGLFQARILERVAISFSRGSSWPQTHISWKHLLLCRQIVYCWETREDPPIYIVVSHFSHVLLFATTLTVAYQTPLLMGFSNQEYWNRLSWPSPVYIVLCLVTQLYWFFEIPCSVAHQAPLSMGLLQARILEWFAMTSSRGFPNPGTEPRVSQIAGNSLPSESPQNVQTYCLISPYMRALQRQIHRVRKYTDICLGPQGGGGEGKWGVSV